MCVCEVQFGAVRSIPHPDTLVTGQFGKPNVIPEVVCLAVMQGFPFSRSHEEDLSYYKFFVNKEITYENKQTIALRKTWIVGEIS